jgi:hypothetical protein
MLVPFAILVGLSVRYTTVALAPRYEAGAGNADTAELSLYVFGLLLICNFPDFLSLLLYVVFLAQIWRKQEVAPQLVKTRKKTYSKIVLPFSFESLKTC